MKLLKIPKHIWWGVLLPLVLVGLGLWRLWPMIEEYRSEEERKALFSLQSPLLSLESHMADNSVSSISWLSYTEEGRAGESTDISLFVVNSNLVRSGLPMPDHAPTHGYYFVAVRHLAGPGTPAADSSDGIVSGLSGSASMKVTLCAYPARYDWRHRRTFFIAQDNIHQSSIFGMDNAGEPILAWSEECNSAEVIELEEGP